MLWGWELDRETVVTSIDWLRSRKQVQTVSWHSLFTSAAPTMPYKGMPSAEQIMNSPKPRLVEIPNELQVEILSILPWRFVPTAGLVCKDWAKLTQELWKDLAPSAQDLVKIFIVSSITVL